MGKQHMSEQHIQGGKVVDAQEVHARGSRQLSVAAGDRRATAQRALSSSTHSILLLLSDCKWYKVL